MRARDLEDIVADIVEASQGVGAIEAPRHLGAARLRNTLDRVRTARLTLMALEARLQQALETREAG